MTIDIKAIDAFDRWWSTRPEPHIPAPRQCHDKMQQDRMLAIWLSAWDAATNQQQSFDRTASHMAGEYVSTERNNNGR